VSKGTECKSDAPEPDDSEVVEFDDDPTPKKTKKTTKTAVREAVEASHQPPEPHGEKNKVRTR